MRRASCICALLFTATSLTFAGESQRGWSFSGATRLRFEAIDGQPRAGFNNSDNLVNLRNNLLAEYAAGHTRLVAEVYDSRVWGDDAGTPVSTGEVNALEPVQAYIAQVFPDAFGKQTRLVLTAGRMTLNLGSRRLVAADDYRNTTSGYTGLRAEVEASGAWKATLIYVLPQLRLPDDAQGLRSARMKLDRESRDLALWGGQLSRARTLGNATAEFSYFHLDERDSPSRATRDRDLDTFGGRLIADPRAGGYDFEVEILTQTGSLSSSVSPAAASQSVRAHFVHAEAGYSFAAPGTPRVSLEFDRASGDVPGGRYGRFDTLFGMRRAELAPAGLYNAVGRANVVTPGVRLEATPNRRLDWFVSYRPLWLDAAEDSFSTTGVRDATGNAGDFAGHQIEGRLRYWIVPTRLRFEFDGLLLSKGRFLRDAPNAPPDKWARYGSLNLTASF